MTRRQRLVAGAFVIVSISHALLGFVTEIPAWKMFARVDRYAYALSDARGVPVDIRDHVQERAYVILHGSMVMRIGEDLVRKHPERAPLHGHIQVWEDGEPVYYEVLVTAPEPGSAHSFFALRDTPPPYPRPELP